VNSRDPLLTIAGNNLGKVDSGELIKISPSKIPRLIGKHGSMIQTIEAATNISITVGQNGLIIFKYDNSTGLKNAIASIKMIAMTYEDANIEEKIQNILDESN
jgi:exosome complex component RRP4